MTDTFEERQITNDEIRVGDRIVATYRDSGGIKRTYEFTVADVDGNTLKTPEGGIFYTYGIRDYILLDRPKPELPTELGSVIVDVTTVNYRYPVAVLLHGDLWGGPVTDEDYYATFRAEMVESFTLARVVKAGDDND